jgi:hypothetical protein
MIKNCKWCDKKYENNASEYCSIDCATLDSKKQNI